MCRFGLFCLSWYLFTLSLSTEEPERIKKQIEEKVDILGDEDVVHVFFTAQYYLQ